MATIRVIDGTTRAEFGRAIVPALDEIRKYRSLPINGAMPGSKDITGYNIVKAAEQAARNNSRSQVNYLHLIAEVGNAVGHAPGIDTLILTEQDIFDDQVRWCFGSTISIAEASYLVLSTFRLREPSLLTHVATHELGHIYGAAPKGRKNTEENLGSHCTNTCVMEQKLSVDTMLQHAKIIGLRPDKFCYDCQGDLRYYKR